ncbi:GroES-like protein, partial [Aureobasidium melanogenum]
MKEAHIDADTNVTLHDVPIPELNDPHQILIKVIVAGCNPKDWKMPAGMLVTIGLCDNSGDDVAGIVYAVGSAVREFRPGDRVAALHQLGAPHGTYAEMALVWDHTTFHIGDRSFEEAAAMPMAYYMASIGLFGMLRLPMMWQRPHGEEKAMPLVIYGASGARKNEKATDKMTEYTKMKNAELEALLKERNLPHTGKKADLVKRLQEHDAETANGSAPSKEDEIDWDDEPTAAAPKASTDAAASAIAAGGQGQPANPQAVPNQQTDIDPSQTDDLTVIKPADDASTAQATDTSAPSEAQPAEPAKPAVDFTSGLAKTTLDQEIEKRKARAKKFGLNEDEDEALKALERAKRFGNTEMPGKLNEALPERRERKRGAPADGEQQGASKKRENNDNKRGGRRDGRRGGGAQNQAKASAPAAAAPAKKEKPQMSEADRAKAEARKARFAAPSSSSS